MTPLLPVMAFHHMVECMLFQLRDIFLPFHLKVAIFDHSAGLWSGFFVPIA